MWGARGPFPLAVALVVAVVKPVVCCCSMASARTTLVQWNPGRSSKRHQDGRGVIIVGPQCGNKLIREKSLLALYLRLIITLP
jgi:hypothetical protein